MKTTPSESKTIRGVLGKEMIVPGEFVQNRIRPKDFKGLRIGLSNIKKLTTDRVEYTAQVVKQDNL